MAYNREKAIAYAHRWAFSRNPAFYDFSLIGGDCTNFISQCLYAGGLPMNYTPETGWFYINLNRRTPSWSGVEPFFRFLTTNTAAGPRALIVPPAWIIPGDIVQLSFNGETYAHSLLVVEVGNPPDNSNILIATHTFDSDYRPLDSWENVNYRYLHIIG